MNDLFRFVIQWRIMIGDIVNFVGMAWFPEKQNWSWAAWHWSHQSRMSVDFSFFLRMLLLVTPASVELSVWTVFLGWGQPISMGFCRMGTIALANMKRPASSASTADNMTNLIIWDMFRMDSLSL